MLCPAVSDPFYGRLYRICGMIHQVLLIPLIGKFVVWTSIKFNLCRPNDKNEVKVFVKETSEKEINKPVTDKESVGSISDSRVKHRNRTFESHLTERSMVAKAADALGSKEKNGYSKQM